MDSVTVKEYVGDIALLGTDKDVIAIFHKGTRLNEIKSREQGTPVYDALDFLKVIHPGEPLNVYDQPVREQDKWRFKAQWDRYQAGASQSVSGTPLSVLFPWNPEIVQTLAGMHITTVQQLAELSDTAKQNLMFGMNLSQKAQHYLSTAEKGREYHQMQAQLDKYREQVDELVATVNELRHKVNKPRLGRPPKAAKEPEAA